MRREVSLRDVGKKCPDCSFTLHVGQEKFSDGLFLVEYCKNCGFKSEKKLCGEGGKPL